MREQKTLANLQLAMAPFFSRHNIKNSNSTELESKSNNSTPQIYWRRLKIFVSNISLEPTFLCILFTSVMYQLVAQNLYLEKACRVNIGYNSSVCDALTQRNISGYTKLQEVEVQKLVSQMLGLRTLIQSFFPVCLVLFLGSWSDRHKRRKPLIIFPIIGEILCCLALIINVVYFYELPLIYTVMGDSLPLALLGGWPCLFIGAYSYVGERCTDSNRTFKMGSIAVSRMVGNSLGNSIGGMLFSATGFLNSFYFCIMSLIFAMILSILLVKEKKNTEKVNGENQGFLSDFFNVHYLVDCLKTCFHKGPRNRRKKIIIFITLAFIITGPTQAENSLNYIFTRYKFGWNSVQYGFFSGIKFSIELTGSFLGVIVLTKFLHCNEPVIGMIGLTGSIIANSVYVAAPSPRYFYIGAVCDFFTLLPYVAVRSLVPKTVPPHELGQTNAVFGIFDSLIPLVFGPLYTIIYKYTIDVFPGTYFLVTVFLKSTGLFLFVYLNYQARKEKNSDNELVENKCRLEKF
ncbi:hypothetical protein WA026_013204 [Henosepilachna vigintioctopunctata]|uniref:Proton-coupled folate transporter n=1 Tax=Henosepilachna vigintioctopunctata TaxID=420089 RepID=A0AAW1UM68_9CUCU